MRLALEILPFSSMVPVNTLLFSFFDADFVFSSMMITVRTAASSNVSEGVVIICFTAHVSRINLLSLLKLCCESQEDETIKPREAPSFRLQTPLSIKKEYISHF